MSDNTEPQVTFGDIERVAVRARYAKWFAVLAAVAAFAAGFYTHCWLHRSIEVQLKVVCGASSAV